MSRFKSFTKRISRRHIGLLIVFTMLIAPAFISPAVESAQTKTTKKATPTPKKKTTPTPKKAQAKTTPTPKKNTKTAAKTTVKTKTDPSSKNKTGNSKTNSKTPDKSKATTTSKNSKNSTTNKNTSSKTTKPTTAKTTKPITKTPTKLTTQSKPKTNVQKSSTTKVTDDSSQVIVTSYSVPIKSEAKTSAKSLSNAKLGTTYKVTEKSGSWYKVQYISGGKSSSGWISGNAVNNFSAAKKAETYRQIAEKNYKDEMNFVEAAEFCDFVKQISSELGTTDADAEIELKRLFALRTALKNIPIAEKDQPPYKEFLKKYDAEIIYNEPAGVYLVAANQFWELHTKYSKSVVSDKIAWEAAMNPLPGECEGYVNCYLFDVRMRFGEYLNTHPNGKNSAEALTNMINYLSPIVADLQQKSVYNGPTDVTDRAEFNNLIAELRTIISRLGLVEKEKALQQLKQIAEAYR